MFIWKKLASWDFYIICIVGTNSEVGHHLDCLYGGKEEDRNDLLGAINARIQMSTGHHHIVDYADLAEWSEHSQVVVTRK